MLENGITAIDGLSAIAGRAGTSSAFAASITGLAWTTRPTCRE